MLAVVAAEVWLAALFGTGDTDAGFAVELLISGTLVASAAVTAQVLGLALPYAWLSLPFAAKLGAGRLGGLGAVGALAAGRPLSARAGARRR